MIVIAILFWKVQTVKDLFSPLSKNTVSENSLTVSMLKGPKLLQKKIRDLSPYFFFTMRELDFENISLSYMLNLRGVS